LTDLIIIRFI